jgi:D-glycero-D-manno-heptose 1,7-bisphosphate phosphatase
MIRFGCLYSSIYRPSIPGASSRPAIFLDRDGVITEETGYLHKPGDVSMLPAAAESIAALNRSGLAVVLVTNQSGIGRGFYEWAAFEAVQSRIHAEMAQGGAWLDAEYACGYYADGPLNCAPEAARFRKPETGMLEIAADELGLSLPDSWIVGDKPSDIETGIRAGLRGAIHVLTGYGAATRSEVTAFPRERLSHCQIHLADSIADVPTLVTAARAFKFLPHP